MCQAVITCIYSFELAVCARARACVHIAANRSQQSGAVGGEEVNGRGGPFTVQIGQQPMAEVVWPSMENRTC